MPALSALSGVFLYMSVIEAIILGLIQGLTEFLPVSSSGHLALAKAFFNIEEGGLFLDAVLHLGTLAAVLFVFRNLIWRLIKAFFSLIRKIFTKQFSWHTADEEERMIIFLFVSVLPLFLILPVKDYIERMSEYVWAVGIALIINSFILLISDFVGSGRKTALNMKFRDAAAVGFVQLIAVAPGISRSGSTITAGVACGLERSYAAQYSFILSVPTILAGAAVSFKDALGEGLDLSAAPSYLTGMIVAAVTGFAAIKLLQYLLKSKKFYIFAAYTFIVGLIAVVYGLAR